MNSTDWMTRKYARTSGQVGWGEKGKEIGIVVGVTHPCVQQCSAYFLSRVTAARCVPGTLIRKHWIAASSIPTVYGSPV